MKLTVSILDLIRRVFIALGWIRDFQIKNDAKKEVHDEVVKTGDKHRDAMRTADGSRVRDDDADLFRD